MAWALDNKTAIYLQLMDHIRHDIITGRYKSGEQIPPVRELALSAAVNPNTMQKALAELERMGLLYTQRTNGRFVTEDTDLLASSKKDFAQKHIEQFMKAMLGLGYSNDEIITFITEYSI